MDENGTGGTLLWILFQADERLSNCSALPEKFQVSLDDMFNRFLAAIMAVLNVHSHREPQ